MSVDLGTPGGAEFALGFEGQVSDLSISQIGSRDNESETPIEFGRAVAVGASGGCVPLDGSHKQIAGLSVMHVITHADFGTHAVNYKQGESVPTMTLGRMFVKPLEDWKDQDAVYGLTDQGGKLGTAQGGGASATRILVPGAKMIGAGTAGTIGEVEVVGAETVALTS
jgi:hypothetical protein